MTFNPSIEVKSGIRADKLDIMERALVTRVTDAGPLITPETEQMFAASGGQESAADSLEP